MFESCPINCIGLNEFTNLIYSPARESGEQRTGANILKYWGKSHLFMLMNFLSFFQSKKEIACVVNMLVMCW